ncbi:fimbria/pilus outer membrane usher protein [Citrobacter braakii]|uniref:fimbria/pilus outer membrane usher protein n=1 Tax=Citrobacter braakii TaxID=57706 RepID=UPI003974A6FF
MKLIKLMLPCFLLSMALNANAETYTFDPAMLGAARANIDMSLLDQVGQLPGIYAVDIILNGEHVDSREVAFSEVNDRNGKPVLSPCLDVSLLKRYGVKTDDYPGIIRSGAVEKSVCARLNAIPEASTELRLNMQQLILNVPQIAMQPKEEGIASQQLWDDDIAAFLMNYSASSDRTEYRRGNSGQENGSVIQLNPGFNFGPWRIRNATTWQKYTRQHDQWKKAYNYAQRDINSIKRRLTLVESATTDAVFDSIIFSDAMLATEEKMIPYNLRQFASVVNEVARFLTRMKVRQNGYLVYSIIFSTDPFSLADLTALDTVGNLDVRIKELDGYSQIFAVPYQPPAFALKEGFFKYSVTAGKYRPAAPGVPRSEVAATKLTNDLPWNYTVFRF